MYDIEGNIVSKKEYSLDTKELLHTDNYEYNNSDWEDQLTKFNDDEINYDAIGNPIMIGNASLTWEGRRLVGYTKGDLNVSYEYNIDEIRTSKIVNGMRYENILEGKNIILEESPNGMIYYIYDSNELIGLKYNSQTYFYKKNLQGDIIGLYNSDFEQIVIYTYDAWGKVLSVCDNNGNEITDSNHIGLINPFRYRSYYYDEETKLYYLNSRYYNPTWGRFVNVDNLLGIINCQDIYVYCNNNPIKYLDNLGDSFYGSWMKIQKKVMKAIKKVWDSFTVEVGPGVGAGGKRQIGPLQVSGAAAKGTYYNYSNGKLTTGTYNTVSVGSSAGKTGLNVELTVTHEDHGMEWIGDNKSGYYLKAHTNPMLPLDKEVLNCPHTHIYTSKSAYNSLLELGDAELNSKIEFTEDSNFVGIELSEYLGVGFYIKLGFQK